MGVMKKRRKPRQSAASQASVGITETPEDILAAARARGRALLARRIDEAGGLITTAEAAKRADMSEAALTECRCLIAMSTADDTIGWPLFQFETIEVMKGVMRALRKLDISAPSMQLNFFFMRFPELGSRRPIDLIREGEIDRVEIAASHYGTQGAP